MAPYFQIQRKRKVTTFKTINVEIRETKCTNEQHKIHCRSKITTLLVSYTQIHQSMDQV